MKQYTSKYVMEILHLKENSTLTKNLLKKMNEIVTSNYELSNKIYKDMTSFLVSIMSILSMQKYVI